MSESKTFRARGKCPSTRRRRDICGKGQKSVPTPINVVELPVESLKFAPENAWFDRTIVEDRPEFQKLLSSIRVEGVRAPLFVTTDRYVISGNHRLHAARLAGLKTVPCIIQGYSREEDADRFVRELATHNLYRTKSPNEKCAEAAIAVDPDKAWELAIRYQESRIFRPIGVTAERITVGAMKRSKLSDDSKTIRAVIRQIITDLDRWLPITVRQLHYKLVSWPETLYTQERRKKKRVYENNDASYNWLLDTVVRMRVEGEISFDAIEDKVRDTYAETNYEDVGSFMQSWMSDLFRDYRRDLMQGQFDYHEILIEKDSSFAHVLRVAGRYGIPATCMRGQSSLTARELIARRFHESKRRNLVLILMSDHDPAGQCIATTVADSLVGDCGLDARRIVPVRAAVTLAQTKDMKLVPAGLASEKRNAQNAKMVDDFIRANGEEVFELEAMSPQQLMDVTDAAIRGVIDVQAYNAQVESAKQECAELQRKAELIRRFLLPSS